ncbi:hypothetical protein [Comamonas sp.]|uniref:allophanate hydrolase-related protein n=1 Tax=Comamonas sp. TaxID=34028 RepID=UPI00264952BC|nr:hypothetical protein [Comamonas sp.]MDN5539231.1 hypothetical protein [Comamonas sp.]
MNPMVHNLESMLAAGKDGALLRYTLGKAYADDEQMAVAREHLRKATALDAEYSVAWKQLGKVELADGRWETGFICDAYGLDGAEDITHFGGWKAWLAQRD